MRKTPRQGTESLEAWSEVRWVIARAGWGVKEWMRPAVEEIRVRRSRDNVMWCGGRLDLVTLKRMQWVHWIQSHLVALERSRARVSRTATSESMQSIQEWSTLIDIEIAKGITYHNTRVWKTLGQGGRIPSILSSGTYLLVRNKKRCFCTYYQNRNKNVVFARNCTYIVFDIL